MRPALKASESTLLKLRYDGPLSYLAPKSNLRHHTTALWLLQHGTKLYLARARHLVKELFYQRAVARFGALPRRALMEPAPIAALVLMVRRCNSNPVCKLSVGSGIEDMVSSPVQPIRIVHFENPADRLADCQTGSRSLSK